MNSLRSAKWAVLSLGWVGFALSLGAATNVEKFQPNPVQSLPTPAPASGALNLRFSNATGYGEKELRAAIADQIEAINSDGLSPAAADDAAFFLGLFYRKNGYTQAEVKWEIAGARTLVLKINAGPLTKVDQIQIAGCSHFSEAVLREYVLGATRERFPRAKDNAPFVEGDIETGIERIRGLYQADGYLEVVVDPPEFSYSRDQTRATAKITIHEGTQYHFGKLTFAGDLVFFPQTALLNELRPFTEKPYTRLQVSNMQRKVIYFYKTRGYFNVKVAVESDPANGKGGIVPVVFHIDSGSVFRFDGVSATGLDRLRPGFLPNRFAKLHGRFYNPVKLAEVYQDMMRTGLFKNLKITSKPLPDDTLQLDMEVEEAKAKEIGFSIGYGTFEGAIIGLHLGDRDFFGTGRPISFNIEASTRATKGELLLIDPWFLESDFALRARLYILSEDFDGYSKLETGLRGELSRKITKRFEIGAFLWTREVEVTAAGIDPLDLGPTSYLVNSVGLTQTLDLRDTAVNTSRGLVFNASEDVASSAIGSSINFVRATFRISYYFPIKKTLLAFGARAGIIHPFGDTGQIPIDERFFNGGSRSVRSFSERELGPRDINRFPIGGETFTTFNVEYTIPVIGDLAVAVFTDAGSLGRTVGDGAGEMRYAVGAGLRYKLPVGPLRLDYGINPSPKENEASGAFHFSFGFAF